MKTHLIGHREIDLTPEVGCHLAGFASRTDPSTGIYHPLSGHVVSIGSDEQRVLYVSAEWLGFYELTKPLRKALEDACGIPGERVILSATHTHCGPCLREIDVMRNEFELDREYLDKCIRAFCDAAKAAIANAEAMTLDFYQGHCDIAVSRRKPNAEGGVDWSMAPEEPSDHEVPVLCAKNEQGELRLVIFGYSCHPTANGGLEIGGDFVGFARKSVEEKLNGVQTIFVQGCGGDQKPNSSYFSEQESFGNFKRLEIEDVKPLGEVLAGSVIDAIGKGVGQSVTGDAIFGGSFLDLKMRKADAEDIANNMESPLPYLVDWSKTLSETPASELPDTCPIPFEVQTMCFGHDLLIVTLAAEMCAEYSLNIKARYADRFRSVFVIGYCNHIIGYLPVKRQIPRKGYEVIGNQMHLLRPGPFLEDTEERIYAAIDACLALS